jgi:hypothetical protein
MTGECFPPVKESDFWSGQTVTSHNLKHSETMTQLVAFGPKALPLLLEAAADRTPAKLKLRLPQFGGRRPARNLFLVAVQIPDGGMEPAREVAFNPMNRGEAAALGKAEVRREAHFSIGSGISTMKLAAGHIKDYEYRVTVGDLCFVAIGRITNRTYHAARYQMTGIAVINSPAHDAEIARAVRSVWTGNRVRRQLFDSLLIDFHSRGGDERGSAERLQLEAATRLLYYFPAESGPVIARRLRGLDLTKHDLDSTTEGFEVNGIWVDELLRAVCFSTHKRVRQEVLEVFRRTTNSAVALATLPAIGEGRGAEVLARLKLFLRTLPRSEESIEGEGYRLLAAIGERFAGESEAIFQGYLKGGSAQRRATMCRVLCSGTGKELAASLLEPLLRDRTPLIERYSVRAESYEPRLPRRVCDEAALSIAQHVKGAAFKLEGDYASLDLQIQKLRELLAELKKTLP